MNADENFKAHKSIGLAIANFIIGIEFRVQGTIYMNTREFIFKNFELLL